MKYFEYNEGNQTESVSLPWVQAKSRSVQKKHDSSRKGIIDVGRF